MTKKRKDKLKDILKFTKPKDRSFIFSPETYEKLFNDLNVRDGKVKMELRVGRLQKGKKAIIL
mgnify:CR=1 FL=1|jgi:hypothetical protein